MKNSKNQESKNKYLIKNTIIFAIGNFATKLISFLLVPLYTNVLTTEEFGTVDLLYTICSFIIPIFSFNIIEAILRFSLDKNSKNNKIMSIAIVSIIFMFVTSTVMIPILNLFKEFSDYKIVFYIYLVTFGTSQIFLVSLKGQEKLKLFSIGNFIYSLSVSLLNIVFLLLLDCGIKGYFLAYIFSNIITIIYGIIFGNIFDAIKKFDFDKNLFKEMIKYSIILIPTSFMWWIMNFMDRVMVTNMISSSANGIYAISYKIPTILTALSSIFTQAWLFSAIREKDTDDNETYTNKMFEFLSFGTTIIAMFLLTFIKPLYKIYVSNDFYEAWKYVPILMIGYIFLNLGTFISTSYNVNKDNKGYLYSSIIGAIVNVILNFILIPLIGIYGAAIATAISYFCVFIFRIYDTKKYVKININIRFILLIMLTIILCCLLYLDSNLIILINLFIILISAIMYKNVWLPILKKIFNKLRKS